MLKLTRRTALLTCAACAMPRPAFAQVSHRGCRGSGGIPTLQELPELGITTGREGVDVALASYIRQMYSYFGVRPGIGLFDDNEQPGAFYFPEPYFVGTADTVIFGRRMFEHQVKTYKDNGISLLGIFAHEMAHSFQFATKLDSLLLKPSDDGVRLELHADFMAGFYLAFLKRQEPEVNLYDAGRTFKALADGVNDDPSHGTSDQRHYAIDFGYNVGMNNPNARPADVGRSAADHILQKFKM